MAEEAHDHRRLSRTTVPGDDPGLVAHTMSLSVLSNSTFEENREDPALSCVARVFY